MQGTVCVTGCSSGIGRATALRFVEEGWRVYATARDETDLVALREAGCVTDSLDVTDDADVERVIDRIVDEEGSIDCLVNNAGYGQFGPVEDVPVELLDRQFDVNVYGPHRLTRAVLPHMREAGRGRIVNVSSVAGRLSFPGGGAYCGSKAALAAMSDALRPEVEPFGIDVIVVEPDPVETGFVDRVRHEVDRLPKSGAYAGFYELLDDAALLYGDGPGASTPEEVAATITEAASCLDPAPRYQVGTVSSTLVFARHLPDAWRDAAYRLLGKVVP